MAKNNPKEKKPRKQNSKKQYPKKKIPNTQTHLTPTAEQVLDGLNSLEPKQLGRAQHVAAKQGRTLTDLVTWRLSIGQDASGAAINPASTALPGKHGSEVTKVKTEPGTEDENANHGSGSSLARGAQKASKETLGASHNSQRKTGVGKNPPKKQKTHHAEPKTLPPDSVDPQSQPVDQHLPNHMTLQLRQSATPVAPEVSNKRKRGSDHDAGPHSVAFPPEQQQTADDRRLSNSEHDKQPHECCTPADPCPAYWKAPEETAPKFYGVRRGHKLGIYTQWEGPNGAKEQVLRFPLAQHKSFKDARDAEKYMNNPPAGCYNSRKGRTSEDESVRARRSPLKNLPRSPVHHSESVGGVKTEVVGDPGWQDEPEQHHHPKGCRQCAAELGSGSNATICGRCGPLCDFVNDVAISHGLFPEQADILRLAAEGHNVFFPGAAGTGKSTVVRALAAYYRDCDRLFQVVAEQTSAALLVNGKAVVEFTGWPSERCKGVSITEIEAWASGLADRGSPIAQVEVLIITEINMVENFSFARLDRIMRSTRGIDKAFGGIQVVVTGDPFQRGPRLPFESCLDCGKSLKAPTGGWSCFVCPEHGQWLDRDKFAWCCEAWDDCRFVCKQLTKIHAQTDHVYTGLLSKHRTGADLTYEEEMTLVNHPIAFPEAGALKIVPRHFHVENINKVELSRLGSVSKSYVFMDNYRLPQPCDTHMEAWEMRPTAHNRCSAFVRFTANRHRFMDRLDLKHGMPVLLVADLSPADGLRAGARGTVIGLEMTQELNLPRALDDGNEQSQYGEQLLVGDNRHWKQEQIKRFASVVDSFPIVLFENGQRRTIYAQCDVTTIGPIEDRNIVCRTQLPLVPGWAVTVPKSKGMRFDRAVIDFSGDWVPGDLYAAMSRVKSLEGLLVRNYAVRPTVRAHPAAQRFMDATFPPEVAAPAGEASRPSVQHQTANLLLQNQGRHASLMPPPPQPPQAIEVPRLDGMAQEPQVTQAFAKSSTPNAVKTEQPAMFVSDIPPGARYGTSPSYAIKIEDKD